MPGLTLPEAAALTGLTVEQLQELQLPSYMELGFGPPHERVLPYMLKGIGKVGYEPAPETRQERAISKLLDYLREHHRKPQTVSDLSKASQLNRPATEVVLATLRVLGRVEKFCAPKHSGKRIFWRMVGGALAPQGDEQ